MVLVATRVVVRRARWRLKLLHTVSGGAVASSVAVSLAVMFGLGVLEFDAVSLVVVAGITIGNAMPSTSIRLAPVTVTAGLVKISPSTATRPASIQRSASRREHRPARAMTLAIRSGRPLSLVLSFISDETYGLPPSQAIGMTA